MSLNILLRSIFFVALLLSVIGCSEEPAAPVPQAPQQPRNLNVVLTDSVTEIAVDLSWRAPEDSSGITGYMVWWNEMPQGASDSALLDATARNLRIDDLKEGAEYTMSVAAMRGTLRSAKAGVTWRAPFRPAPPSSPTNLQATSLGSTAVGLSWTAPVDTGLLTYTVSWMPASGGSDLDSGTISGITSTSHAVTVGLRSGRAYIFSIRTVRGTGTSSAASITWAGAQRFSNDASNTSYKLRLYEPSSSQGGGLTIDPSKGGPRNISMISGSADVQLGLHILAGSTSSFTIGPAYAIDEFSNAASFDSQVFISDTIYPANSLNVWFPSRALHHYIPGNGNLRAYTLPVTVVDARGFVFIVRTGPAGNYHYARVFIKNVGGKILQGTAPNRYIEVEISYQVTPNLPYA